jgi:hypothetical protein
MADRETHEELNRLYWESDASVTEIGDRLGLSRRALYEGIDPRPAGAPCPDCGTALVFRNRTAAENREAECPECGREMGVPDRRAQEAPESERDPSEAPLSPARRVPTAGGAPALGIALLVGLTLGVVLAYLLRER